MHCCNFQFLKLLTTHAIIVNDMLWKVKAFDVNETTVAQLISHFFCARLQLKLIFLTDATLPISSPIWSIVMYTHQINRQVIVVYMIFTYNYNPLFLSASTHVCTSRWSKLLFIRTFRITINTHLFYIMKILIRITTADELPASARPNRFGK